MKETLMVALFAAGVVVFGTSSTLICKSLLSTQVMVSGVPITFAKPAFATLLVFAGFASTLPAGIKSGVSRKHVHFRNFARCLSLSSMDIISLLMMNSGLVFVTASTSLMLRMSSIAFTALFSRLILGRQLRTNQLIGIVLLLLALTVITWAVTLRPQGRYGLLGCALTVFAQVFRGLILVGEEMSMSNLPPFGVLAGEGLISGFIMLTIVMPIMSLIPGDDNGQLESLDGTLNMLCHSNLVVALAICYVGSVSVEQASAIMVTAMLSSVHRSFLQFGVRIVTIWCADLALSWISGGLYGEKWDSASNVQLIGFVLLLLSTLVYFSSQAEKTSAVSTQQPLIRGQKV